MHRAVPSGNKLLQRRWEEHVQALHYERLRTVKSSIDSTTPLSLGVAKSRAKKEQQLEDRYLEIERENRMLLGKMTSIMNTSSVKALPHAKRSLNVSLRKRDLIKITLENQALLKRLTDKQPCYRVGKWEGERVETEKLLDNICEFPYQLGITRDHRSRAVSRDRPQLKQKRAVYKRGVRLGDRLFLVEMATDHISFVITVSDAETPDRHVLELPYRDAVVLMGSTSGYEALVKMFFLDETGQLVLRDTKSRLNSSLRHNASAGALHSSFQQD